MQKRWVAGSAGGGCGWALVATVRISFLPFGMADDASDHAPCMPLMKTARNYFVPGNASVGQISSTEYSRWFLEFKLGERL
jgi:hypothetical protein